jgi:hypothetical protein
VNPALYAYQVSTFSDLIDCSLNFAIYDLTSELLFPTICFNLESAMSVQRVTGTPCFILAPSAVPSSFLTNGQYLPLSSLQYSKQATL